MASSVQQFWQMIVRSGLHDEAACRQFADTFFKAKEAGELAVPSLPEWLVANKALTRYQAKILIAGRPGPFVFGEYVVTERIDAGRLAGQFRAHHRASGAPVCLQFISGPAAADGALLASLRRQATAAAALSRDTTRLAHCYALVDIGSYKFFVLEALAGQSLTEQLARPGVLAPVDAVRIVTQLAQGLVRLHRAQRAHGEISTDSIWLDSSAAKLLSFPWSPDPLAKQPDAANSAAADYWPPERTAQAPATASGDVYALGCILYQLISGKRPFAGADGAARRAAREAGAFAPLEKIAAGVAPELAALVARSLAKNPAERFANATELAKALARHEGGVDDAPPSPAPLRVALDATIGSLNSQTSGAAAPSAAIAQPKRTTAQAPASRPNVSKTPAKAASAPATEILQPIAAAQPAGASSLAGLYDPDEPARTAKPRPVAAQTDVKKKLPLILAAASTGVVLIVAGVLILSRGFGGGAPTKTAQVEKQKALPTPAVPSDSQATDAQPNGEPAPLDASPNNAADGAQPKAPGEPAPPGRATEQLVGIGAEMWASPTAGKPLDLAYLPPGAEVIVALRAADLARHPESQRLLDPRTTGALGTWISERLPALAGAPLDGIDQALIALLPVAEGTPRMALVAQLKTAPAEAELLKSWGDPKPKESDGVKYFQKEDTAYYIPSAGAGRTIVVAPAALLVEDVLPNGANPPALRREMEILLRSSDADRLITLLAAPNILLTGGEEWLPGSAARARWPLDWFLAGEPEDRAAPKTPSGQAPRRGPMTDLSSFGLPKGVLASAHLTATDLFVEVRLLADPNQPAAKLAEAYRERVARLPRKASDYLRTLALGDYSRDVLFEFPLMVEQLAHFTVAGTEGRQVVLRTYLPALAAHNLALAGHLAMLERPRPGGGPATNQTAGSPTKPASGDPTPTGPASTEPVGNDSAPNQTVAQRLDRKISLNFDRNTLEPTLKQIGQEIGVDIVIMGADLQSDGITRNKAIDKFAERDLSAREILLKIMLKANPDGKLIYVIKPSEDGSGETLHFTTRAAAAARGDKLPAEFEK